MAWICGTFVNLGFVKWNVIPSCDGCEGMYYEMFAEILCEHGFNVVTAD